jgi:hypothetical protein
MVGGTLAFCLILGTELIALFWLLLPDFVAFADNLCGDVYGDVPALPEEATTRGMSSGGRAGHERGPSLTRYKTSDIAHRNGSL